MKEAQWCKVWVGAKREDDGWSWVGSGNKIQNNYLAVEENDGGRFGAFEPSRESSDTTEERPKNGFLFRRKNVDWGVHGYVIERQAVFASTYTLNAWVVGRPPDSGAIDEGKYYQNMSVADGDVPLFSEGTGPVVMPQSSDVAPPNFRQGGQGGFGLSRLCIDRYGNMANSIARMDGSVESVKLMDLWKQKWHRGWKPPSHVPGF